MDLVGVDKKDLTAERADETSEDIWKEWHRIPSFSSGEIKGDEKAAASPRGNNSLPVENRNAIIGGAQIIINATESARALTRNKTFTFSTRRLIHAKVHEIRHSIREHVYATVDTI